MFAGFLGGWDRLRRLADPTRFQMGLEAIGPLLFVLHLVACFVALRLYCIFLQAAIHASTDATLGFRAALRKSKGRGYAFLVLFLLQQLMLQASFVLLILPGLVLAVWFSFALWAFARDSAGIFQSFGDSARAVRGKFFGVLGRMLLAGLIGGAMMIVPIAGWLLGPAWLMLAWGALYEQLRVKQPGVAGVTRSARTRPSPTRVAPPLKATP